MRLRQFVRGGVVLTVLAALVALNASAEQPQPPQGAESSATPSVVVGPSPAGNYLAARVAQRRDDWAGAWTLMSAALTDDNTNTELVRQGFLAAVGAGRMQEATELAKQIVGFDPQNYFATTLLTAHDFSEGRYREAKQRLLGMSPRGANRLLMPLLLSWADAGLGSAEDASLRLKQQPGGNPAFILHGGLIADHLGNAAEAATWFDGLDEKVRLPGRTLSLIGGIYERADRKDAAEALYRRWAQNGPDASMGELALARFSRGEPPPERLNTIGDGAGEAFLDLASALRQENANDLGVLYAQLAAFLRPTLPATAMLLGDLAGDGKRFDEAIAQYARIDRSSDLWWLARLRTADVLERVQRMDEAVAVLRELTQEFPGRPDPFTLLGDLLRRSKRFNEAIVAYDQAVERLPETRPRDWSLFYARGVALERTGQWPRAEADLLKALDLQGDHPQVLNYLAYAWTEQGVNLERAHDMLRRAVELRPNDGYIIDSLGWVLYRLGRYDEAVAKLERAVEIEPHEAELNEHLGDIYWHVGRRLEARFQWLRALQQTTDEKDLAEIREKLEHGMASAGKTARSGGATR